MMRKIIMVLLLCVLLAVLSGCSSPQYFPTVTKQPENQVQAPPTDQIDIPQGDTGEYEGNPMDEEGIGDYQPPQSQYVASSESYIYAGATPLPLDPIDMPTPTPRSELTFNYELVESTALGLKFEGPAGWTIDESAGDTIVLNEPAQEQKDNYSAFISLRKTSVSSTYSIADMENEVKGILSTIRSTNYTDDFRPSATAKRDLLDKEGVYADYRGVLANGAIVRGRVHVTCIDKTLYILHMSHPANYNTDYLKIHAKIKETLELIK